MQELKKSTDIHNSFSFKCPECLSSLPLFWATADLTGGPGRLRCLLSAAEQDIVMGLLVILLPAWGSGVSPLALLSPLWKASASTTHLGVGDSLSLPLPSGAATDPADAVLWTSTFLGRQRRSAHRGKEVRQTVAAFQPSSSPRPQQRSCAGSDHQPGGSGRDRAVQCSEGVLSGVGKAQD